MTIQRAIRAAAADGAGVAELRAFADAAVKRPRDARTALCGRGKQIDAVLALIERHWAEFNELPEREAVAAIIEFLAGPRADAVRERVRQIGEKMNSMARESRGEPPDMSSLEKELQEYVRSLPVVLRLVARLARSGFQDPGP